VRKRTFSSWAVLFVELGLVAFLATFLSFMLFSLANFSDNLKRYSFYIKTNNSEMTKRELIGLHYFYDLSQRWNIQSLADKYLFMHAPFYEVSYFYLINDWKMVQEGLKEKLDDPMSYSYGNARFRQAQFEYKAGQTKDALNFVFTEVSTDYEKALRNCLDSSAPYLQCYDRVWNYDLVTNKKSAEEALKGQKPQPKFILGPPKDDKNKVLVPSRDRNGKPGDGKEGEEKPGEPAPRKRP